MTININTIKNEFIDYLEKLGSQQGKEYKTDDSLKSVFLYANEFENFLDNELGLTEEEIIETMHELSIGLSNTEDEYSLGEETEIEKLSEEDIDMLLESINSKDEEIEEGMETKEDDLNEESADVSFNETTEEETEKDLLIGILGEICKDEEFRGLIDTDEDGNINKEELLALIDTIKSFDTDEANLTLTDLIEAGKAYKNGDADGTFEIKSIKTTTPEISTNKTTEGKTTKTTSKPVNRANYNRAIYTNHANNTNNTLTLDEMNSEQLKNVVKDRKEALQAAQTEFDTKQKEINDKIETLETNANNSFKLYTEQLEACETQEAKQLKLIIENKKAIADKNFEIQNNETEIQNQKTNILNFDAELNNLTSYHSTLQGRLSELENAKNNEESKGNECNTNLIKSLEAKIAKINSEINSLDFENRKKQIESNKKAAEDKILELEENNKKLKEEITALNESITLSEDEIAKLEENVVANNSELKNAQEQYNNDKMALESARNEKIDMTKIIEAQKALNEAQEALTKQLEEEAQWKYSTASGANAVEWARQYDDKSQSSMEDVFRKNNQDFHKRAWCGDFARMALEETIGADNLPEWYRNCNQAYCPDIQRAGAGHEVSAEEAQAGDLVLFDWDGDGSADHVGLFIDNGDGSTNITTIEGNTSNRSTGSRSSVEEKERNRNDIIGIYSINT
ncbi:MAG: CHAP domain-containing protein [Candidatus Gastranaerophilales bacterium]|nr:CHAP domain-containing protein [Candidatus Gastranaerophilales bacterium]